MNRALIVAFLLMVGGAGAWAAGDAVTTASVIGRRVNVRAKPELNAEVVGQLQESDTVRVKSVSGDWVEIMPPPAMDLWINKDFVEAGRVTVNNVNVRAGPGINYSVVGTLQKDEVVNVRGAFDEWVKVTPPPAASLWVSRELLALPEPGAVASPAVPSPITPVVTRNTEPPQVTAAPDTEVAFNEPPRDLSLHPGAVQGAEKSYSGTLKKRGALFGTPGDFRLVTHTGRLYQTVCYLRGNSEQMKSFLDREMTVTGPTYWPLRSTEPVVVVRVIRLADPTPAP